MIQQRDDLRGDLRHQHLQHGRDILPSFYRTVADDATRPLTQQRGPMQGRNAPAWVTIQFFYEDTIERQRSGDIVSEKGRNQ